MERRKIQRVGTSTLSLSLPHDWTVRHGLGKGDEILVEEVEDGLRLFPRDSLDRSRRAAEGRVVEADLCREPGILERILVAHYVLGRRRILVRSRGALDAEQRSVIDRVSHRLLGLGVIEESPSQVTLRCSIDPAQYPLPALLRRLQGLAAAILEGAVEGLLRGDAARAEEALRREDDADAMYWLAVRQCLSGLMDESLLEALGLRSRLEISGCRVTARDLESAADRGEDVARAVLVLRPLGVLPRGELDAALRDLARDVSAALAGALHGLLSGDLGAANAAIQARRGVLERGRAAASLILRDHGQRGVFCPLSTVLDGIVAVSSSAGAIGATAFNRHMEEPSERSPEAEVAVPQPRPTPSSSAPRRGPPAPPAGRRGRGPRRSSPSRSRTPRGG